MPLPGDQHKPNGVVTSNPFDDAKPQPTSYTAQEIATLQSRLDKQLGPEYICSRKGPGGQTIHYLAADKVIGLANEVFGFNGWSSSIQNIQIDFVDENSQSGRFALGLSVIVRVTLKDGTFHEDIGYGQIENCKGKAAAFEKAKKEGATDALKRALRSFGNVLGNCLYDQDYVKKVSRMKVGTGKWDPHSLHRHADFAPRKEEPEKLMGEIATSEDSPSAALDESFNLADFTDDDIDDNDFTHPDRVILPREDIDMNHPKHTLNGSKTMMPPFEVRPPTPAKAQDAVITGPSYNSTRSHADLRATTREKSQYTTSSNSAAVSTGINQIHGRTPTALPQQHNDINQIRPASPSPQIPPVALDLLESEAVPAAANAFYSARAIKVDVDKTVLPNGHDTVSKFNPNAESPSIRKTAGINHNITAPVKRDIKMVPGSANKDHIDPRFDPNKRGGFSGQQGQSPSGKGPFVSAYRPPTRRGPDSPTAQADNIGSGMKADRGLTAVRRVPLGDVSNLQHVVTAVTPDGGDAKRQKISEISGEATKNAGNAMG